MSIIRVLSSRSATSAAVATKDPNKAVWRTRQFYIRLLGLQGEWDHSWWCGSGCECECEREKGEKKVGEHWSRIAPRSPPCDIKNIKGLEGPP